MDSITDLLASVKFLPTIATYCEFCARPLCIMAQPCEDIRRLIYLHSQACPCRLKTRTLRGLLRGKAWALPLYRTRRRILYRRLGHQPGLPLPTYPLPESLRRDIETIYAARKAAQEPCGAKGRAGAVFRLSACRSCRSCPGPSPRRACAFGETGNSPQRAGNLFPQRARPLGGHGDANLFQRVRDVRDAFALYAGGPAPMSETLTEIPTSLTPVLCLTTPPRQWTVKQGQAYFVRRRWEGSVWVEVYSDAQKQNALGLITHWQAAQSFALKTEESEAAVCA